MAYDEALASRIRDHIGGAPGLSEKKMFGGLAFLIGGNMAVAASGQGGILVRVHPDESEILVASTPAEAMEMRGKQMPGWLRIPTDDVSGDAALAEWATPARCPPSRSGSDPERWPLHLRGTSVRGLTPCSPCSS